MMLLSVENLSISFRTDEGPVTPVQGVSFDLAAGRTLGLVGESGSGKSVTTKALMRLLPGSAKLAPDTRIRYRDKAGQIVEVEKLKPDARCAPCAGARSASSFRSPWPLSARSTPSAIR